MGAALTHLRPDLHANIQESGGPSSRALKYSSGMRKVGARGGEMRSLLDWMRRLMFSVTLSVNKEVDRGLWRESSENFRDFMFVFALVGLQ